MLGQILHGYLMLDHVKPCLHILGQVKLGYVMLSPISSD